MRRNRPMRLKSILFLASMTLAVRVLAPSVSSQSSLPIRRSSSAIGITADGGMLVVVNPDSNSVTLVDTTSQRVIAELPVGVDPRTVAVDDAVARTYVANRGSDSVSVVDLTTRQVITDVTVGNRPYGVLVDPDGSRLYVAEQGLDRLAVLDTTSLQILNRIAVADRPSGLGMSSDGRKLYVTHLLGNTISVVNVRPYRIYLPLLVRKGLVNWLVGVLPHGPGIRTADPSNYLAPSFLSTPFPITTIQLWPDSNLVQSFTIAPDGAHGYVPHTRSNTANRALTFDTTVFPLVSLVDLQAEKHLIGQQIDLGTLDPPGVGLPFDGAITPDGEELWIVNAASNDLSVIDLARGRLAAHIEVGANPRGIVLAPDGSKAYVNNTLAGTVSVLDTSSYTVTAVITVTEIPLPPLLLEGKRLFHSSDDSRMARAQWISCNTCHFEGEHDGRTWTFGFSGPRNTTSLLGMIETYPLRWSGEWDESADSEFANRKENFGNGLLDGEMNCSLSPPDCVSHLPNQGRSRELDALAAFIDGLQISSSPAHAHGESLTAAEQRGRTIFNGAPATSSGKALDCVSCHPPPLYTDHQRHDVGTATVDEKIGPAYDTPSLRGLYDSAPFFHDGSAATLYETLIFPSPGYEHDVRALLSESEIQDLIAFLMALPYE